jgi:hypothetical protein
MRWAVIAGSTSLSKEEALDWCRQWEKDGHGEGKKLYLKIGRNCWYGLHIGTCLAIAESGPGEFQAMARGEGEVLEGLLVARQRSRRRAGRWFTTS